MDKLLKLLKGKKTFLCAIGGGVVVTLKLLSLLDDPTASTLLTLLGFGAAAALRSAIK